MEELPSMMFFNGEVYLIEGFLDLYFLVSYLLVRVLGMLRFC